MTGIWYNADEAAALLRARGSRRVLGVLVMASGSGRYHDQTAGVFVTGAGAGYRIEECRCDFCTHDRPTIAAVAAVIGDEHQGAAAAAAPPANPAAAPHNRSWATMRRQDFDAAVPLTLFDVDEVPGASIATVRRGPDSYGTPELFEAGQ